MPFARRVTNWYMSGALSRLAGRRLTDTQSGFRLVRTAAWEALGLGGGRFDTESEMLVKACRAGLRVVEVPVRTIYAGERSEIRVVRDTLRWIRLVRRLRREAARSEPHRGS
jgi:hypothetical protein